MKHSKCLLTVLFILATTSITICAPLDIPSASQLIPCELCPDSADHVPLSASKIAPGEHSEAHTRTIKQRSVDDDELFRRRAQLKPSNARRRQIWKERMDRIKDDTASEEDRRIIQNVRDYSRGYVGAITEREKEKLESGEMTYEELQKMLNRRRQRSRNSAKYAKARREAVRKGKATEKQLAQNAARRAYDKEYQRKRRAKVKAMKESGMLTEKEMERFESERIRLNSNKQKRRDELKAMEEAGELTEDRMEELKRQREKHRTSVREYQRKKRAQEKQAKAESGQKPPEVMEEDGVDHPDGDTTKDQVTGTETQEQRGHQPYQIQDSTSNAFNLNSFSRPGTRTNSWWQDPRKVLQHATTGLASLTGPLVHTIGIARPKFFEGGEVLPGLV